MADTKHVILTAEQVAGWQRRKIELEQQVAAAQQEMADLVRRLDAAAVFMVDANGVHPKVSKGNGEAHVREGESMMDTVLLILGDQPTPMTKAALKARLRKHGYSGERLGNYFYTVIKRLKDREKITVHEDGQVSRV